MADIVNLRLARKRRDRAAAARAADANRAAHGRSAADKAGADAERARLAKLLDQAERER